MVGSADGRLDRRRRAPAQRSAATRGRGRCSRATSRPSTSTRRPLREELGAFIGTEEGKAWVKQYGLEKDVKGLEHRLVRAGQAPRSATAAHAQPGQIIALSGDFYERWVELATRRLAEVRDPRHDQHRSARASSRTRTRPTRGSPKKPPPDKKRPLPRARKRNTRTSRRQPRAVARDARRGAESRGRETRAERRVTARRRPGRAHDDASSTALFIDAAAGHFLTDAFAAGHLFDKERLMAQISCTCARTAARRRTRRWAATAASCQLRAACARRAQNVHDRHEPRGLRGHRPAAGCAGDVRRRAPARRRRETQRIAALAIYVSRQQVFARGRADPRTRRTCSPSSPTKPASSAPPDGVLLHPCGGGRHAAG